MRFLRVIILALFCIPALLSFAQAIALSSDTLPLQIRDTAITQNKQVIISAILLSGNTRTKGFIVMRELPFHQGDQLALADLNNRLILAKQQLMNTTLFVDVNLYISLQKGNFLIIKIDMKERWYLFPLPYFKLADRNFNQWWVQENRNLDRVNYGIKFIQNNFTGRNDNVDVWLITGYTQQITLRYDIPFFDKKLKSGINVGFTYATQKELNYATADNEQVFYKEDDVVKRTVRFDLTYSYRPDIKQRHYLRISYNSEQVADTIIQLNPLYYPGIRTSIRYIDFNYQYKYYNVDYISYPTKGFLFEGNLYSRGINRSADLWQASFRAVYAIPLTTSSFLHLEALGMAKLPFDDYYFDQRLLGYGHFQMRGLEYNVIDGVLGGALKTTIHRQVGSFVVRNPFPSKTHDKIPFRIFLKAYGDIGYGYTPNPIASNTLNNTLLRTWGIGMDIVTIYDFVFKIEYSFNQLRTDGLYLQSRNDF